MAEKRKKKRPNYILIAAAALVLVVVLILVLKPGKGKTDPAELAVEEGRAYLNSLLKKDPEAVSAVREEIFMQHVAEQRDTFLSNILSGTVDPFPMFQDFAILGDSRAVGFWYHNFLDESRVLADGGNTIRAIPSRMAKLEELQPKYVYLCYGLNDVSIGYWDTAEEYTTEYMKHVRDLQELLPDAKIVVCSMLPATDPAFKRSSRWKWIPDWSKELERVCQENGVLFANCDLLFEEYSHYWGSDGIHFHQLIYPYWAGLLLSTGLYGGITYEG